MAFTSGAYGQVEMGTNIVPQGNIFLKFYYYYTSDSGETANIVYK